ncbi:MAG TPA: hypothetical protein VK206_05305 [Anaerolineales bacterium]|nr:hypothetical protein [Anaerolineales bacterium]
MNQLQQELFEQQLSSIAKGFDYPRAPDIAGFVVRNLHTSTRSGFTLRAKRLAWSLTIILVLISSLMLIPPARAAILEFIQIGVVRIFRTEPTPLLPPDQQIPSAMIPATATPALTAQPLIPILENLAGEMTLEEAQKRVDYPILLPSYPPDLGKPDLVFVQNLGGDMTVLVWLNPQQPDQILMSLHFIPMGSWAMDKMQPKNIQETTVNGQRAIWAEGPYPLMLRNGDLNIMRLINGHVLIWAEGEITYRLETDLSLEEAIKIAESLQPIKP